MSEREEGYQGTAIIIINLEPPKPTTFEDLGYVQIVKCKDCRHCTFSDGEQLADCMIKQGWFPVKPDWFCADGERRLE